MPDKQQDLFFTTASTLVKTDDDGSSSGVVDDSADGQPDSSYGGSASSGSGVGLSAGNAAVRPQTSTSTKNGGVVFLVVTDSRAQVQTNFQRLEASDQVRNLCKSIQITQVEAIKKLFFGTGRLCRDRCNTFGRW